MPDFSSNIAFTVRFDLTIPDAPVLVLTDTGVGVPNGAIGHYDITQPNGVTRFGSASAPDITIGTNGSYRFILSHAYALAWQLGTYTVAYTLSDAGYTDTLLSKTFTFNFAGLALGLDEQFDVFTPLLKYNDATDYTVPKFNAPTIARAWAANSPATGNIVSTNSFIDLSVGGNYYSSVYSISLTSTITYQSSVYSYLSFVFIASESEDAETAIVPPSLNLMLSWVTSFRRTLDRIYDVDKETLYAYASGLFSELKYIICNGGNDMDLTRKLYGATHRDASLTAKVTNLPIASYDYSACGISNVQPTPLSITVQPQSATITAGGNINLSVTATGGTGIKTFQWFKAGVSISGATSSTFTIPNAQVSDSGGFSVTVSDSAGNSVTSATAILVVNAVVAPMVITTQPSAQSVTVGATYNLGVTFTGGTGPWHYHWFKNGTELFSSASGSRTYTNNIATTDTSATGNYHVEITDDTTGLSVTSNTVAITINAVQLVAHYNFGSSVPETVSDILAGLSQNITHNADIAIAWPLVNGQTNQSPMTYWMAQPIGEPAKLHSNDGVFPEPIGPNQTYDVGTTIGGWLLYHTGNPTSGAITTTYTNA